MHYVKKFLICIFFLSSTVFAKDIYPVVIIGGGVGGLTSGVYLARGGIQPLILDGKEASLITQSHSVENWPGEEKIAGADLIEKLKKQAIKNGCIIASKEAVSVDFSTSPFKIVVKDVFDDEKIEIIQTLSCIIATGTTLKKLGVEGEDTFWGKGVSHCALCDGAFYKDKKVAVIGGGNAAIWEALYLSNIAKKVFVLIRKGAFRNNVDQKNKEILLKRKNVQVIYNTTLQKMIGEKWLQAIEVKDKKTKKRLEVDGVFLAIGSLPNSQIFQKELAVDKEGYILVNKQQQTSKEGVFAIGDVTNKKEKQALFAAADGAKAAISVQDYMKGKKISIQETKKKNLVEIVEIRSKEHFEKELNNAEVPVVVDFYAVWCGPCKKIAPFLAESAEELSGTIKILKVDVDKQKEIAKKYKIEGMPTVIVFDYEKKIQCKKKGSASIVSFLKSLHQIKGKPEKKVEEFIRSLK